jgi:hypothetical protein
MNVFLLGLRITADHEVNEDRINVIAESLPASEKKVPTKVQLFQDSKHYVGKLLKGLAVKTMLALGPTRPTPDRRAQTQPTLVVTKDNFEDLLAVECLHRHGWLGSKKRCYRTG